METNKIENEGENLQKKELEQLKDKIENNENNLESENNENNIESENKENNLENENKENNLESEKKENNLENENKENNLENENKENYLENENKENYLENENIENNFENENIENNLDNENNKVNEIKIDNNDELNNDSNTIEDLKYKLKKKEENNNENDENRNIENEEENNESTDNENINYENLTITELKKELEKRTQTLLKLNNKKKKSKNKLNLLLKKLNDLYTNESDYLMGKKNDKLIIAKIKHLYDTRKKDLQISKQSNQTFKTQYLFYSKRLHNVLDPEKIQTFEEQIDNIKKENLNILDKIKELNYKNLINSIELKNCSDNKKYPSKIKNFNDDVKSFSSQKHDYHTKLNMNKRSLDNLIKEKEVLKKLYNINIKEDSDKNLVSKINYWLNLINEDLEGKQDEIFERVEKDKSKIVNEIDRRKSNKLKIIKNPLYLPIVTERSSKEKKTRNPTTISVNKSANLSNQTKKYQGIFNKYSLLKDNNNYNYNNNNKSKIIFKSIPNLKKNVQTDLNSLSSINNDYYNTTDHEYRELLGKKESLVGINSRIENRLKEINKVSIDKLQKISRNLNDNVRRLESLNQKNELLNNEIINLEKLLELNIHQNKIKDEIKNNESRFMILNKKKINDLFYNNENILNELNEEENNENDFIKPNDTIEKMKYNLNNNIIEKKIKKEVKEKEKIKEKKIYLKRNININIDNILSKKINYTQENTDLNDDILIDNDILNTESSIRERKVQEIKNKYFPIDRVETNENNIQNNYQNENDDYYSDNDYNNNSIDELFNKKITIINQKEKY